MYIVVFRLIMHCCETQHDYTGTHFNTIKSLLMSAFFLFVTGKLRSQQGFKAASNDKYSSYRTKVLNENNFNRCSVILVDERSLESASHSNIIFLLVKNKEEV